MTVEFVTTSEAARLLGVHPETVRRWTREGVLPSSRTAGRHRRIRRSDIEDLARERDGERRHKEAS
jgi:excisionase family DNA binding protein